MYIHIRTYAHIYTYTELMEYACVEGCRYLHMQLTPKMWQHFEEVGDLPKDRHVHTKGDKWWMDRYSCVGVCMYACICVSE